MNPEHLAHLLDAEAILGVSDRQEHPKPPRERLIAVASLGWDAVRLALEHELERDPDVFIAGVDAAKGGNVFTLTRGLHARWPERLLDTPISETAVMGLAIAAAEGFWTLDAPVMRVAPPPTPAPYAPNLEAQWLPDRKDIERAVEELVRI